MALFGSICSTVIFTGPWGGQMCSLEDNTDKRRDHSRVTDTRTASKPRTCPWQLNAMEPTRRLLGDKNVWGWAGGSKAAWHPGTSHHTALGEMVIFLLGFLFHSHNLLKWMCCFHFLPKWTALSTFCFPVRLKFFLFRSEVPMMGTGERIWKCWGCFKPSDCFLSVHFLFKGIVCVLYSLVHVFGGDRGRRRGVADSSYLGPLNTESVADLEVTYPEYTFTATVSVSPVPICLYSGKREQERREGREGIAGSYIRQRIKSQALLTANCSCCQIFVEMLFI